MTAQRISSRWYWLRHSDVGVHAMARPPRSRACRPGQARTYAPIVAHVCGPDRKTAYEGQLENMNSDAVVDIYDKGKRDSVSATKAEEALRKGDLGTLSRIVHPVAFQNITKWKKFYE